MNVDYRKASVQLVGKIGTKQINASARDIVIPRNGVYRKATARKCLISARILFFFPVVGVISGQESKGDTS